MAAANATLAVKNQWLDRVYKVLGIVTIGASPLTYTAGGIPFNLNQSDVKAQRTPEDVKIYGQSGYIYSYVKGTDNSNGLLKVFVQDAVATNPLAEMADALAIPAGLSGDVIRFEGTWRGMN